MKNTNSSFLPLIVERQKRLYLKTADKARMNNDVKRWSQSYKQNKSRKESK